MTNRQFELIFEDAVERERATLCQKANEYARGDRLSNFKLAGARQECTPERALEGMMEKHSTSIHDCIADIERGQVAPLKVWREKIGDARNYLLLLEALVAERLGEVP
ncbi:MAG TPA: hypothetical protein VLH56_00195 [Dissulfurispiraceae bacterium]|nr:hypothetical protein [Dissulfurispiraceae bacterium]